MTIGMVVVAATAPFKVAFIGFKAWAEAWAGGDVKKLSNNINDQWRIARHDVSKSQGRF